MITDSGLLFGPPVYRLAQKFAKFWYTL